MIRDSIFALDLGVRCGFACGRPNVSPRSGIVLLKQAKEPRAIAGANLMAWLCDEWGKEQPALVVKEAALPLQAYKDRGNSEDAVKMAYALHGIMEALCVRFCVPCESVHPATIRKHFIGQGRAGSRTATKAAVVQRAILLGYIPRGCTDDDRADACSIWDFACAAYAQRIPATLHLFGETAEPVRESNVPESNVREFVRESNVRRNRYGSRLTNEEFS